MMIRHATTGDLDALTRVEAECFPAAEAASRASIEKRLGAFPKHFTVLEEDGRIVSFINGMVTDLPDLTDEMYDDASMHDENGAWQMIFGVDTVPDRRRQGCAAQVMRAFIAEAEAQGRKGLVLTCKEHLIHWYASFGYVDEGVSASEHGGVVWHQMRLTFAKEA